MARRAEQQKQTVIEAASDLAVGRLDKAHADAVRRFVAQFYARVAPADLADRTAEQLYSAAASLWEFARQRPPGGPIVRVFNPPNASEGPRRRTIVEIVNDDMPFLVDSVSLALNAEGGTIDLIIHPILRVERDAAGCVTRLYERGESGGQGESVIHVEIGLLHDPERLTGIAARLHAVLRETRAAVEDWRKMREALAASRRELEGGKPPVAGAELAEALDFLAWLDDDNFTYLGCRDYRFAPAAEIGIAPGLGILRDTAYRVFDGLRDFAALPPDLQAFLRTPRLLLVSKSSGRAVIHRPAHMDAIGVKVLGERGEAVGMRLFLGLFTSQAYRRSTRSIPLLRGKVAAVLARSGLEPASHDGKALAHILETLPRDELFQASDSDLFDLATGILRLQERQRVALFARRDPCGRFVSCFVFVPRDRYDTALRESFAAILESGFAARVESFNTLL
ncbi:MAG: NAD-glutamate dehydrogenase, partial [Stellaceae bacterium]